MAQAQAPSWRTGGPPATGPGFARLPGLHVSKADAGNADTFLTPSGLDAILACYKAGIGVLISKTSDGGALSVMLYHRDSKYREYAGNADEADTLWEGIHAFVDAVEGKGTARPVEGSQQPAPSKIDPSGKTVRQRTRTRT